MPCLLLDGSARGTPDREVRWCCFAAKDTQAPLDRGIGWALDRLAAGEGVSRAEIIRRLLDRALAGQDDSLEVDLMAIDRSFGVLAEIDLPDRRVGEREEHLARIWQAGSVEESDRDPARH